MGLMMFASSSVGVELVAHLSTVRVVFISSFVVVV